MTQTENEGYCLQRSSVDAEIRQNYEFAFILYKNNNIEFPKGDASQTILPYIEIFF